MVDMRRAIAVSSDVYFYEVGGGFGNQKGLGAHNVKKYLSLFGLGDITGVDMVGEKEGYIPDPDNNKSLRNWTVGDTYHLSIGQGDLLVTPMQVAVYVSALASKGIILYPHLVSAVADENERILERFNYAPKKSELGDVIKKEYFDIIHEAMRGSATYGTASGLGGLPIEVAAKTGTAEIGDTGRVHSWSIGFLPYKEPRIAFTILMENGSVNNLVGGTYVASQVIQWMASTDFLTRIDSATILSKR
jgi:penicillin-binding protein 2